jgi:hypothetical protein
MKKRNFKKLELKRMTLRNLKGGDLVVNNITTPNTDITRPPITALCTIICTDACTPLSCDLSCGSNCLSICICETQYFSCGGSAVICCA